MPAINKVIAAPPAAGRAIIWGGNLRPVKRPEWLLALARRGRLVTCGATSGPNAVTELRYVFSRQLTLLGSYMGSKADLLEVARFFFEGKLRPVVHASLPLAEAGRAHEMLEASEHFGKIVLRT